MKSLNWSSARHVQRACDSEWIKTSDISVIKGVEKKEKTTPLNRMEN